MECENTYNPPFSRVRAYIQEFLYFCCHKCHRFICKCIEHRFLPCFFECFLTVYQCISSKSQCRTLEKRDFPSSFLLHSSPYFPPFPSELPLRVTLVTAKKHNCGWNVRAYAYARETPRLSVLHFQNRSAKKGRSPRTIRNYLVILLGNAGRLRLMKGAFECSQRCIKWKSQPILQQHLLRTKLYVIISPIVY